ncbi:MAG TPA: hypothetical protein VIJ79_01565 [Acidobacteriaceae bacterium]
MRIAIEDLGAHVATLEAELRSVRAIELTRDDMVVAEVRARPSLQASDDQPQPELPDFIARLREIYGDKPLNVDTTEWIREGRE